MVTERRVSRGIQSITVGGRLLQALIDAATPLTLRELAQRADITPAQAHAYLVSHKRVGMVVQEFESGPYMLGPFALRLGLGRLHSVPVFQEASTLLKDISSALNVMATLVFWSAKGPTVAMVSQAIDKRSDLNVRMGTRFSVLNTSTGRVFAAYDDRTRVEAQIAEECARKPHVHHPTDVMGRDDFWSRVEAIRDRGFATIEGARVPGINAVSVPLFDGGTAFAGVVTCIGRADILSTEAQGETVRIICGRVREMGMAPTASSATA